MFPYSAVYLAEGRPAIIAASHYNDAAVGYERDDPILVHDWPEGDALGAAVRTSIALFCHRERNLRGDKKSDWPSYIASGCKSVAEFEGAYQRIQIRAVNDAQVTWEAEAKPNGEPEISLCAFLHLYPSSDEESGRMLVRLWRHCSVWYSRMQDLIP